MVSSGSTICVGSPELSRVGGSNISNLAICLYVLVDFLYFLCIIQYLTVNTSLNSYADMVNIIFTSKYFTEFQFEYGKYCIYQ